MEQYSLFVVIIHFLLCLLELFLILDLRPVFRDTGIKTTLKKLIFLECMFSSVRYWFGNTWAFGNSEIVAPVGTLQIPF